MDRWDDGHGESSPRARSPAPPPAAGAAPRAAAEGDAAGPPLPPRRRPCSTCPRAAEPEWYGLYVGDKKVGWLKTSAGAGDAGREERPGRRARRCSSRRGSGSGVVRRQVDRGAGLRAGPARPAPLAAEPRSPGDGGNRSLRVTCGPATCKAEITADDGRRTTEFPHPGETAEQVEAARLAALTCKPVSGAQLAVRRPAGEEDDAAATPGRTRVGGAGVEVPVSIVEEMEDGDRVAPKVLVADDGRILETRVGDGMVIRLEPAETARQARRRRPLHHAPRPAPGAAAAGGAHGHHLRAAGAAPRLRPRRPAAAAPSPGAGGETLLTVTAREFGGPGRPPGQAGPARRRGPGRHHRDRLGAPRHPRPRGGRGGEHHRAPGPRRGSSPARSTTGSRRSTGRAATGPARS